MSKEVNAILKSSLLQNERVKRLVIAFIVLFLAMLALLLWIGHLASRPATDVREMVVWAVIAMVVIVCYGVMVLALYINRANARLLRTLEQISSEV